MEPAGGRRNWALVRSYYCRPNEDDEGQNRDQDAVAVDNSLYEEAAEVDDRYDGLEFEDDSLIYSSCSYLTSLPESRTNGSDVYPAVTSSAKTSGSSYGTPGTSDGSPGTPLSGDDISVSSASVVAIASGADDPPLPVRSTKKMKKISKNGETKTWNERILSHLLLRTNEPKIKNNEDRQCNRKSLVDILPGSLLKLFSKSCEKERDSDFINGFEDKTSDLDEFVTVGDDVISNENSDNSNDENFWSEDEFDEDDDDDDDVYANMDKYEEEKEEIEKEKEENTEENEKEKENEREEKKKKKKKEEEIIERGVKKMQVDTVKTPPPSIHEMGPKARNDNYRPSVSSSKPIWNSGRGSEKIGSTSADHGVNDKIISTACSKKYDVAANNKNSVLEKISASSKCRRSDDAVAQEISRRVCVENKNFVSSSASSICDEKVDGDGFGRKNIIPTGSDCAKRNELRVKPKTQPKRCNEKAATPSSIENASDSGTAAGNRDDNRIASNCGGTGSRRCHETETADKTSHQNNNTRCQRTECYQNEKMNSIRQLPKPTVFPKGEKKMTLFQISPTSSPDNNGTTVTKAGRDGSGRTGKLSPPVVPHKPGGIKERCSSKAASDSRGSDGRPGCATETDCVKSRTVGSRSHEATVEMTFDKTAQHEATSSSSSSSSSSLRRIDNPSDAFHGRSDNIRKIVQLFDGGNASRMNDGLKPAGKTLGNSYNKTSTTSVDIQKAVDDYNSKKTVGNEMSPAPKNAVDTKSTSKPLVNRTKSKAMLPALPARKGGASVDNQESSGPPTRRPLPPPPSPRGQQLGSFDQGTEGPPVPAPRKETFPRAINSVHCEVIKKDDDNFEQVVYEEPEDEAPQEDYEEPEEISSAVNKPLPPIPNSNGGKKPKQSPIESHPRSSPSADSSSISQTAGKHLIVGQAMVEGFDVGQLERAKGNLGRSKTKSMEIAKPVKPPVPVRTSATTDELKQMSAELKNVDDSSVQKNLETKDVNNNTMEQQPWYFGDMAKEDCEKRLTTFAKDGGFVVRRRSQKEGENFPFALALFYRQKTYHLLIRLRSDGKFALGYEKDGENVFNDVIELLTFYRNNPVLMNDKLRVKLTECPSK